LELDSFPLSALHLDYEEESLLLTKPWKILTWTESKYFETTTAKDLVMLRLQ
jgi:hypothetical protein